MDKGPLLDVWRRFKADPKSIELRNILVEHYMPVVEYHARCLRARMPGTVELGDLIGAGVFGLVDAIHAFDLNLGVQFQTFSELRIRGSMLDAMRQADWVPRSRRRLAAKLEREIDQLACRYGRPPTADELAERMGISVDELCRLQWSATAVGCESLTELESERQSERIPDRRGEDPTRRVQRMDLVREATRGMKKRERLVALMYYVEGMKQKEIGESLGVAESRVSHIVKTIRERMRSRGQDAHQRGQ